MGNASTNPVRNLDKRTARREYREDFVAGIKLFNKGNRTKFIELQDGEIAVGGFKHVLHAIFQKIRQVISISDKREKKEWKIGMRKQSSDRNMLLRIFSLKSS